MPRRTKEPTATSVPVRREHALAPLLCSHPHTYRILARHGIPGHEHADTTQRKQQKQRTRARPPARLLAVSNTACRGRAGRAPSAKLASPACRSANSAARTLASLLQAPRPAPAPRRRLGLHPGYGLASRLSLSLQRHVSIELNSNLGFCHDHAVFCWVVRCPYIHSHGNPVHLDHCTVALAQT